MGSGKQSSLGQGAVQFKELCADLRRVRLPIELDGARILSVRGTEVFSAYIPSPRGPVFMKLIEKTFGEEVTTRTWDTVGKVVAKGS